MKRLGLVFAVCGCVAPASAGILVGASGSSSSGEAKFTPTAGINLFATVDFAVWSPGNFTGFTGTQFAGAGTFNPNEYVYAYQIFNTAVGSPPPAITAFGVNSAGGVFSGLASDDNFGPNAPTGGFINVAPLSANYFFSGILSGSDSTILLFSSPNPAGMAAASLLDTGQTAGGTVPSPVPVPGSALLGALGLGVVAWAKRRFA